MVFIRYALLAWRQPWYDLFDLFRFVGFIHLSAHQLVCPQAYSFSRLRREISQIFPNLPNLIIIYYLFDLFRFVGFLSAGHSFSRLRRDELMSRQVNKSYKYFQILQFLSLYIGLQVIGGVASAAASGSLLWRGA